jgi:hypothetical protein
MLKTNVHLNSSELDALKSSIRASETHWKALRRMLITGKADFDQLEDVVHGMEITIDKLERLQKGDLPIDQAFNTGAGVVCQ